MTKEILSQEERSDAILLHRSIAAVLEDADPETAYMVLSTMFLEVAGKLLKKTDDEFSADFCHDFGVSMHRYVQTEGKGRKLN